MAQPLPLTPPLVVQGRGAGVSAYETCLRMEDRLGMAVKKGKKVGNDLVYIRILGYLLNYAVSDHELTTLITEILSAVDDDALLQVGEDYFHYLWAFGGTKDPGRMRYVPAEGPSFKTTVSVVGDTLNEDPKDHRKLALIRDGYRCVVTGSYDLDAVEENQELQDLVISDPAVKFVPTQLAHIFDVSTNQEMEPISYEREHATLMWAVLYHFGHENLPATLKGELVHRLENVMTLSMDFHTEFNRLKVWFVATGERNKYKIEGANSWWLRQYPEYVTFTTPDQHNYPVPDPIYLAIHAACARVALLSGAAAIIEKNKRDMEDRENCYQDAAEPDNLPKGMESPFDLVQAVHCEN